MRSSGNADDDYHDNDDINIDGINRKQTPSQIQNGKNGGVEYQVVKNI